LAIEHCAMTNGKRRAIDAKTDSRWQWRAQLADVLTLRDQGLLTQSEYQEKIEEVLLSLPEETRLEEHDLPRGGTRFVLREAAQGRLIGKLEFRNGRQVDG